MKAEEILEKHIFNRFDDIDRATFIEAMQEYAAQQVSAERERIKECIRAREIRVDPMFYLAYQDIYKIIDSL